MACCPLAEQISPTLSALRRLWPKVGIHLFSFRSFTLRPAFRLVSRVLVQERTVSPVALVTWRRPAFNAWSNSDPWHCVKFIGYIPVLILLNVRPIYWLTVKAFPWQVLKTEGEWNVWPPPFTLTLCTAGMTELSALRAGRTSPQRKFLGTHLCKRLSGYRSYWMRIEGIGHLKISKCPAGNRTRNRAST